MRMNWLRTFVTERLPALGEDPDPLLGHTARYLVGEGVSRAIAFAFFIGIAVVLPVADYGLVNLYVSFVALGATIVGLGLPNAVLRFRFEDRPFDEVLGTTAGLMATSAVVMGFTLISVRAELAEAINAPVFLIEVAAVGIPVIAFRNAWLNSLQADERSRRYAAAKVSEPLLMIAAVGGSWLLLSHLGPRQIVIAYSGATLIIAAWGLYRLSLSPGLRWARELTGELLTFGGPLVLHTLAMTGLVSLDQILIGHLLGPEATGVYAFGYRFGMAMIVLCLAFSNGWTPMLFRHLEDGDSENLELVAQRFANLLLGAGIVLMLGLPLLITWIGGARYGGSAPISSLIVYAYCWYLLYLFASSVAVYANRTRRLAQVSSLALAINVTLDLLFVPRFGVDAAAFSTIVSYATLFGFLWWWTRDLNVKLGYGRLLGKVLLTTPVVAAVYIMA